MLTNFPSFSSSLASDPTTRRIWYSFATVHDFESHDEMTEFRLYGKIFQAHCLQFALIFLWAASLLIHISWQGNFEEWILNPTSVKPIAHSVFDPHFGSTPIQSIRSFSGLYQLWFTIGLQKIKNFQWLPLGR